MGVERTVPLGSRAADRRAEEGGGEKSEKMEQKEKKRKGGRCQQKSVL